MLTGDWEGAGQFQSLSRVADHSATVQTRVVAFDAWFQSLSRVADHSALGRKIDSLEERMVSIPQSGCRSFGHSSVPDVHSGGVFQSLSRVADHSAGVSGTNGRIYICVSIPQSGCRSFGRVIHKE